MTTEQREREGEVPWVSSSSTAPTVKQHVWSEIPHLSEHTRSETSGVVREDPYLPSIYTQR